MKHPCLIALVLLLVWVACTPSGKVVEPVETPSAELASIDSLMWIQPDSALVRLLDYFQVYTDGVYTVSTADTYNRHYAHLLLSELLYKNDSSQTNRAELRQAVAYFDSLMVDTRRAYAQNRAFLDARAHYINGVGFYEKDSVVQACSEYMKALEVMEDYFGEKELVGNRARFIALTYTRLSMLFSDTYLHEQAIYFAQNSLSYYQIQDLPSWHVARMLNEIGIHYDMMNELDSAEYYYQKAVAALHDTNTLMYRDIATRQAYLKYKKNPLQADAIIHQLGKLLSQSESNIECLARRASTGEIYYHEKQFDSAWHYLNIVYRETSNLGTKKQAAERLVEICKVQGWASEMLEYAEFLVPFANQEENNSGLKSQLTELNNAFKRKKLEQQQHYETKMHAKLALLVFGGMLAGLLAVIIFYHKSKRSKQRLEVQMEAERHAHKIQQAALAGRLRQSNAALKKQGKTASSIFSQSFEQDRNGAENYADEPVCQQILSVCNDKSNSIKSTVPVSAYADIALDDAQKAQLKDAALRHYGPLFEKLRLQHPEMKEKDFLYCYLCLLGLDNVQIAVLLQNSTSTIWERENRLKKILGSENKISIVLFGLMNN